MINTLFSQDALGTPLAFFLSLLIGCGFGFALERAGFSSSRRLAGLFYFTDMAVLKVMFTALITALLGLSYMMALGWIQVDQIFLMPTIYGAQIVGGLLFGIGFVVGAWCPGTAAAGLAAGRVDALVFLLGAIGGSVLFNEVFPQIRWLYTAGDQGVQFAYDALDWSRNAFILMFTLVAVGAFWLAEGAEKVRNGRAPYLGTPFLKVFSLALLAAAGGLFVLAPKSEKALTSSPLADEQALLAGVDAARDHIEPEELADRLMSGDPALFVMDVRPAEDYARFHIRGAINVPLPELAESLQPHKNKGLIVLYSNGMVHPAQARDSLQRQGFSNVYILTDGLQGFRERCLKPVSLRPELLPGSLAERVNAWRTFFSGSPSTTPTPAAPREGKSQVLPLVVEPDWVEARLGSPGFVMIDLRPQPEYNAAHIPGSLSLNAESLRGNIGGIPSMLLPASLLAAQFSLLGLKPDDTVVLVAGEKFHDATLVGMAFERLGHKSYAVLSGGYARWEQEARPATAALPPVPASQYPVAEAPDHFTVDSKTVAGTIGKPGVVILDVRPPDFFSGKKSDEARAGHIPGALNRSYTDDVLASSNKAVSFKSLEDLEKAYRQLIPSKTTEVIVHCRTGHQASQTWFLLTRLLGYSNVRWYDAGWTEWAARPELPVVRDVK
jgi:thiosulfate/3-mercaptopyruvate sulfurtransferase